MRQPVLPLVIRQLCRRSGGASRMLGLLLVMASIVWAPLGAAHAAAPFNPGDLVVGLGSSPDGSSQGLLRHFSNAGTFLDTLLTTSGSFEETGACFDTSSNLYTTNFEADSITKFDANGNLLQAGLATGLNQSP